VVDGGLQQKGAALGQAFSRGPQEGHRIGHQLQHVEGHDGIEFPLRNGHVRKDPGMHLRQSEALAGEGAGGLIHFHPHGPPGAPVQAVAEEAPMAAAQIQQSGGNSPVAGEALEPLGNAVQEVRLGTGGNAPVRRIPFPVGPEPEGLHGIPPLGGGPPDLGSTVLAGVEGRVRSLLQGAAAPAPAVVPFSSAVSKQWSLPFAGGHKLSPASG
jgi:hypothetical protein